MALVAFMQAPSYSSSSRVGLTRSLFKGFNSGAVVFMGMLFSRFTQLLEMLISWHEVSFSFRIFAWFSSHVLISCSFFSPPFAVMVSRALRASHTPPI